MTPLLIGGYTPDKGHGTGIVVVADDGSTTTVATASPSWIARHPSRPVLYAVAELDEGGVAAWALVDGVPAGSLAHGSTGGADPCHLTVDASGQYLVTVNYTGGSVCVHRLRDDGGIGERTDFVQHKRHGRLDRQDGAHPHMVRVDGTDLLVADLGGDAIYRYRLDDGRLVQLGIIDAPAGSGPRHMLPVGAQWLVTAELSNEVLVFDGDWNHVGSVPSTRSTTPGNRVSELVATGGFLYVGNRGADTVTVFALTDQLPDYVAEVAVGRGPRHVALDGDLIYTANELSDDITVLRIDPSTGIPVIVDRLVTPSPTCVLIG